MQRECKVYPFGKSNSLEAIRRYFGVSPELRQERIKLLTVLVMKGKLEATRFVTVLSARAQQLNEGDDEAIKKQAR